MATKPEIRRGDIVDVDLSGALGGEKRNGGTGTRPCLVVQNDVGNKFSPLTIVAPLTDMEQFKDLPVQVAVRSNELHFKDSKDSVVECGHLRSIDAAARISTVRGTISGDAMIRVDRALAVSLGLSNPG